MAQTSYTSPPVTAQTRKAAYRRLIDILEHIPSFHGVDLISIVRNADNTITLTVTNPIPADQVDHLGL